MIEIIICWLYCRQKAEQSLECKEPRTHQCFSFPPRQEQRVKSDSVPVSDPLPGIKSIQSLPGTSRQTLITYNSEQSLSSHDAFLGDKTGPFQGDRAAIIQAAITLTQLLWRAWQWFHDHVTASSRTLSIIIQFGYTTCCTQYQSADINITHLTPIVTLLKGAHKRWIK